MAKKKTNTWVKKRHKFVTFFFYPWFFLYYKLRLGLKIKRPHIDKRQYLVVSNHQTPFDQFFVSLLLRRTVYYVASEDLYQKGFLSKLLHFLVAPIPIKKNNTDVKAVMTMLRVKKEGGTIAIFPEGNRTYSGKTESLKSAIGGLLKVLKLPVMVLTIDGGFGVIPRFSSNIRKGEIGISVKKIIEYDEYKDYTDEQCYEMIKEAIYHNDYDSEKPRTYKSKRSAEFIERSMYVCPDCGISKFYSKGDKVKCLKCGKEVKYDEYMKLSPVKGSFPFSRMCDWYDYQRDFISSLDLTPYFDRPLYEDHGNLVKTDRYKKPVTVYKDALIALYGNRYEISGTEKKVFDFDDISAVTAQNENTLIIFYKQEVYQIRSHERFNVVSFVNIFYHYKNNLKGNKYEFISERTAGREFLGL